MRWSIPDPEWKRLLREVPFGSVMRLGPTKMESALDGPVICTVTFDADGAEGRFAWREQLAYIGDAQLRIYVAPVQPSEARPAKVLYSSPARQT